MKTKLVRLTSGLLASLLLALGLVRTAERLDRSASLPDRDEGRDSRVAAAACVSACYFSGEMADRSALLAATACVSACHFSPSAEDRLAS